ncbi:MAG: hypothetical protein Kow001_04560 [Acidobacteriota bacterium]
MRSGEKGDLPRGVGSPALETPIGLVALPNHQGQGRWVITAATGPRALLRAQPQAKQEVREIPEQAETPCRGPFLRPSPIGDGAGRDAGAVVVLHGDQGEGNERVTVPPS